MEEQLLFQGKDVLKIRLYRNAEIILHLHLSTIFKV